ncbi:P-loop containing nucleoside triphosphate hydrolase protein [Mrakia frigida]|uniref:P-loop containing nucleoside triphosphate hydrolase protein n=1 Tax=Mrakia frigida TaxID=29902 RepID=UPI003FCBF49B
MSVFWKPGTAAPGSTVDRETEAEGTLVQSAPNKYASLGLQGQRQSLPIFKHRDHLLYAVEKYPVVIVVGQTGCGKTTQLPQYLHEAGWSADGRVVGCTQPRRVAATSVATRVAEEMGSVLGDEVGYTIRFEDKSSPSTKIKYLTDGMLFRETMLDPLLQKYSVIMIDEAHERGAYTDLLLGILKKIRRKRPELRIIISSATIDAEDFREYFNSNVDGEGKEAEESVIISLEGRMYPVEVAYLSEPSSDYVEAAVQAVFDIHAKEPAGDILVFLTGREEIDSCIQEIAERIPTMPKGMPGLLPLPLHSGLTAEEQAEIFEPPPRDTRKVIVSTNIAEASVTIEGIKFVVDCGFVKLRTFNPHTGTDLLSVVPCSLASLNQRAGRAGRTSPGKTFRLFPSSVLPTLPRSTVPEICRSDISLFVLQLKALGIENVIRGFDFMTPPPSDMMMRALEFLYSLKALDEAAKLTRPLGMWMAEMPVEPMMAAILLNSHEFRCGEEVLTIAAMTSVQNVFITGDGQAGALAELEKRKFTAEEGDHLTLLNVYNGFTKYGSSSSKWCSIHRLNFKALSRAVSIRQQLKKYLLRFGKQPVRIESCEGDQERLRRCLVTGYFKNAARWVEGEGTYRSVRENAVLHVHPSSVLFTRKPSTGWVIYHEVVQTTKSFMRDLTVVEKDWLGELAPDYYEIKQKKRI